MELFKHIDFRQTDRQTDGLTELFLKLLLRLKKAKRKLGMAPNVF